MLDNLREMRILKRFQKTLTYARLRRLFPMPGLEYVDDRDRLEDAEIVTIDWPADLDKPRVGIVQDYGNYPQWTKYSRLLEKNAFPHALFNIHSHAWLEEARRFDVVVGIVSSQLNHLEEIRQKYFFLERYSGISCFPSTVQALLYENKSFEAYIAGLFDLPFAKTYVSYDRAEALGLIYKVKYPLVSKVDPSSGSVGVELLRTPRQARKIIKQAFRPDGRKVHVRYFRQKDRVYFQEFIPNDGYDIRVILVGNWAFGYHRKVLKGDFRASGMHSWEKRALPEEAIRIAWNANKSVQSPLLVVDMVHGLDGRYSIIEYSPFCQMDSPEELHVNGVPGVYIIGDNGEIRFEKGRYWVAELALREFLVHHYLPAVMAKNGDRR